MARRGSFGKSAGNLSLEFNTWGDMLEYVGKTPLNPYKMSSRETGYSGGVDRTEWTKTANFEAAMELAFNGWEEAAVKARTLSSALFDKVSSLVKRDEVVYDVEGIDVDMGAYLRNEPECWLKFEEHTVSGEGKSIVRIAVNISASWNVPTETIIARGAAVAALIELLEYAGRRAEVYMDFNIDALFVRTLVKAADQPLDMARMMYSAAHPSMLRRLMFSALEHNRPQHEKVGSSYGMPADTPHELRGDIYLGKMHGDDSQWSDPESAKQWVMSEMRAQGVEIHEPERA